jgi:hypothetical protein
MNHVALLQTIGELPLEHAINSCSPLMQKPAMKAPEGMRVCSITPLLR